MKRLGLLLLLLAFAVMLGGNALAQGDKSVYFTTYYSNANTAGAPDQVVRIINDGDAGNLWAGIYVFDDSQELQECCTCYISPDGLLSESVNKNLTANSLTGKVNTRGVIKIVSYWTDNPATAPEDPGLHGWATHVQATTNEPEKSPWFMTETALSDSNLTSGELTLLQELCYYDSLLSGQPCSCTPEDYDF